MTTTSLTPVQARRRVVYAPGARVTHRPAEVQGIAVLTGCGITLHGYSEDTETEYPTCKRCASKC